jgi:hypothetical protein
MDLTFPKFPLTARSSLKLKDESISAAIIFLNSEMQILWFRRISNFRVSSDSDAREFKAPRCLGMRKPPFWIGAKNGWKKSCSAEKGSQEKAAKFTENDWNLQ